MGLETVLAAGPPPPPSPPSSPGVHAPALWLNPYANYAYTYQSVPDSHSVYNPVVFASDGVSISGNANGYSYLGARFYQQVPAGTTVTAVVEKDESCDDHYVAFSTSPNPTAFSWSSASDRVLFVFDCDNKVIFSTAGGNSVACSTRGQSTWSLTLTATTATWTDTNCGTMTVGTYPIPDQLPREGFVPFTTPSLIAQSCAEGVCMCQCQPG